MLRQCTTLSERNVSRSLAGAWAYAVTAQGVDGELIVKSSRRPLVDAAAFMVRAGIDPATRLAVKVGDSETILESGPLGVIAAIEPNTSPPRRRPFLEPGDRLAA